QAEDGIRDFHVTGVQTCALPISVLDRTVMSLADRGGASNLIGDRWADVAAAYAMTWPGQSRPNPENSSSPFLIERVARLDDIPRSEERRGGEGWRRRG